MGLSRRKRARVQAEVKTAMGEFAAAVQTRLNTELARSNQAQVAMLEALRSLHAEMQERDTAFAVAFTELGAAIDNFTTAIEADRSERRSLVEAVNTLATRELEATRPRVVGGRATRFSGQLPSDIEMVREADERGTDDITVHP
jgi:hypothetical protein